MRGTIVRIVRIYTDNDVMPRRFTVAERVGRFLARWPGDVDVRVGPHTLALDLRDGPQRRMALGTEQRHVARLIRGIVRPGDVVYDVGANVGAFSHLSAAIVGPTGQVH